MFVFQEVVLWVFTVHFRLTITETLRNKRWQKNIQAGQKALKMIGMSMFFKWFLLRVFCWTITLKIIKNLTTKIYSIWTKNIENCSFLAWTFLVCGKQSSSQHAVWRYGGWTEKQWTFWMLFCFSSGWRNFVGHSF